MAERWESARVLDGLSSAIQWRTTTRRESLERTLAQRQEAEQSRITANLEQFAATLRTQLDKGDEQDALFSAVEAQSKDEIAQYHRDRRSWEERLRRLEGERDLELEQVAARYADPQPHSFPVAVIFVVPQREAL
jgi:hypothetical protein